MKFEPKLQEAKKELIAKRSELEQVNSDISSSQTQIDELNSQISATNIHIKKIAEKNKKKISKKFSRKNRAREQSAKSWKMLTKKRLDLTNDDIQKI